MYRRLSADKDAYITNKVINGERTTDANTGFGGTLDLFKLYDESRITGQTGSVVELSRALIHFDLDPLRSLTGSILDFTHSSFKATLKLRNVFGGQTIPSNFKLIAYPLSKSWNEGKGFDVSSYRDVDVVNFLSATNNTTWSLDGANKSGTLGDSDIDIIEQGNLGSGIEPLFITQSFSEGTEDLSMDITKLVSATLAKQIPDYGFRLSFTSSQETDTKTRFVKRFTSRHTNDPALRPSLEVIFDDTIEDNHSNFIADVSGTLFLNNFHRGEPKNILLNGTEITGTNSLILHLTSGSGSTFFEKFITASQHQVGDNFHTGVYSATFAISPTEQPGYSSRSLAQVLDTAGSATFTEIWESLDGSRGFYTGSFVIETVKRTAFDQIPDKIHMVVRNNNGQYQSTDKVRFHIYAQSILERVKASKLPLERKSLPFSGMKYQIRDANSGKIHIPFDDNGTKLSVFDNGMYFDLYMSDLHAGRTYGIELRFTDMGIINTLNIKDVGAVFTVIS